MADLLDQLDKPRTNFIFRGKDKTSLLRREQFVKFLRLHRESLEEALHVYNLKGNAAPVNSLIADFMDTNMKEYYGFGVSTSDLIDFLSADGGYQEKLAKRKRRRSRTRSRKRSAAKSRTRSRRRSPRKSQTKSP